MLKITISGRHRLFRLLARGLAYALFLGLLGVSAFSVNNGESWANPDIFARMDPLNALALPLAAREFMPFLWPGLLVLASAVILGRFFCSHVCPMGTTLDIGRTFLTRLGRRRERKLQPLNRVKWGAARFWILGATLGAAILGVNLAFWSAPMPLISRFYAEALHPLWTLAGNEALSVLSPVADSLNLNALAYAQIAPRRFSDLFFTLFLFCALVSLETIRPRFWCRFLCPAGALLGLLSFLAVWRPRVSPRCSSCGACARVCPAECRSEDGASYNSSECLACRECEAVCPNGAISFIPSLKDGSLKNDASDKKTPIPAERRAFLFSAGAGAVMAMASMSEVQSHVLYGERGLLWADKCIRPPGAVPEYDFLDLCVRCGLCMKICPSNGLQPAWLESGAAGMFSPLLVARRGACEPGCRACGSVCPTGAVRRLPLAEKQWAKMGTATIHQQRCVAWNQGKSCVVCQEVCPYGSVSLLSVPGKSVPVPFVMAEKCFGCGYCENHCPARLPAIVVEPLNSLRLKEGSFKEAGLKAGFKLEPSARTHDQGSGVQDVPPGELPPGFTD